MKSKQNVEERDLKERLRKYALPSGAKKTHKVLNRYHAYARDDSNVGSRKRKKGWSDRLRKLG